MNDPPSIRFFIDHCVPESAARTLEAAGHEVLRLRTKTAPDSPDILVAAVAEANHAVLVTMDSDFKAIASRTGIGKNRFRRLSLVRLEKCRESQVAIRMTAARSLILHEWRIGNGDRDRRLFVVIAGDTIRTHR